MRWAQHKRRLNKVVILFNQFGLISLVAAHLHQEQSFWAGAFSLTRTQRVWGFVISVVCKY